MESVNGYESEIKDTWNTHHSKKHPFYQSTAPLRFFLSFSSLFQFRYKLSKRRNVTQSIRNGCKVFKFSFLRFNFCNLPFLTWEFPRKDRPNCIYYFPLGTLGNSSMFLYYYYHSLSSHETSQYNTRCTIDRAGDQTVRIYYFRRDYALSANDVTRLQTSNDEYFAENFIGNAAARFVSVERFPGLGRTQNSQDRPAWSNDGRWIADFQSESSKSISTEMLSGK